MLYDARALTISSSISYTLSRTCSQPMGQCTQSVVLAHLNFLYGRHCGLCTGVWPRSVFSFVLRGGGRWFSGGGKQTMAITSISALSSALSSTSITVLCCGNYSPLSVALCTLTACVCDWLARTTHSFAVPTSLAALPAHSRSLPDTVAQPKSVRRH